MKNAIVIILSKTEMNNGQVCVGGITSTGQYVRLLDPYANNQPKDTQFAPGQMWDIKFMERPNVRPPHIEDILCLQQILKEDIVSPISIKEFLEDKKVTIWRGHPDNLFDGLIQWTENGSGYIDEAGGLPSHSVGFWISDKALLRKENNGIRYLYPQSSGWRSIKYKGFDMPLDRIPAGTLIRVSLARWKSFMENEPPKCWLQLSGWYL